MDLFVDSGIIIHLFDINDDSQDRYSHFLIKENFEKLAQKYPPLTSNLIIAEALNLISNRINAKLFRYEFDYLFDFYEKTINGRFSIVTQDINKYIARSWKILKQYSNLNYSFIDAMSLSFIEDFGDLKVLTTDEHWTYFHILKGHKFAPIDFIDMFSMRKY
jgi:predicted nucleic acid-binding protein